MGSWTGPMTRTRRPTILASWPSSTSAVLVVGIERRRRGVTGARLGSVLGAARGGFLRLLLGEAAPPVDGPRVVTALSLVLGTHTGGQLAVGLHFFATHGQLEHVLGHDGTGGRSGFVSDRLRRATGEGERQEDEQASHFWR